MTDIATAHGSEGPHAGMRNLPMIGAVEAGFTPSAGSYGARICRRVGADESDEQQDRDPHDGLLDVRAVGRGDRRGAVRQRDSVQPKTPLARSIADLTVVARKKSIPTMTATKVRTHPTGFMIWA